MSWDRRIIRTVRVRNKQIIGTFANLLSAISAAEGSVGEVKIINDTMRTVERDITVYARNKAHMKVVIEAIRNNPNTVIDEIRDEVFEMAEQIERNGAAFYRAAADKLPELRNVLLDLATMEDEHETTFAAMRAELSGLQAQGLFDPDSEAQMYLRVLADGKVFDTKADPVEQLAGRQSPQDVLEMAIGLEKDSVAFYVGLKEAVSGQSGKDKIDDIIKQEIGHIATLKERLQNLQ